MLPSPVSELVFWHLLSPRCTAAVSAGQSENSVSQSQSGEFGCALKKKSPARGNARRRGAQGCRGVWDRSGMLSQLPPCPWEAVFRETDRVRAVPHLPHAPQHLQTCRSSGVTGVGGRAPLERWCERGSAAPGPGRHSSSAPPPPPPCHPAPEHVTSTQPAPTDYPQPTAHTVSSIDEDLQQRNAPLSPLPPAPPPARPPRGAHLPTPKSPLKPPTKGCLAFNPNVRINRTGPVCGPDQTV